jgi:hypothetical protein
MYLLMKQPLWHELSPDIDMSINNPQAMKSLVWLNRHFPNDRKAVVLTDDIYKSFPLVAATGDNIKILAALPTSSVGDGVQRGKCLEYLNETFDIRAMKQIGIGYLYVSPNSRLDTFAKGNADVVKYIISKPDGSLIYRINLDDIEPKTVDDCVFNEKAIINK